MKQVFCLVLGIFFGVVGVVGQTSDSLKLSTSIDDISKEIQRLSRQGEFDKAIELVESAESQANNFSGKNSPLYAKARNARGAIYYFGGRYQEAESIWLEVKELREKTLGNDHLEFAKVLNNLGALYNDMGRYSDGEPLFGQAKPIMEKKLGKEHIIYGALLNNYANLCTNMGLYEKAEELYLESKTIRLNKYSRTHSEYASVLINLGGLYYKCGRLNEALNTLSEAKKIYDLSDAANPHDYATCLQMLGLVYHNLGFYKEAENLYKECMEIRVATTGKQHPDYSLVLNNLAVLCRDLGRFEEAESLHFESIRIQEEVFGKLHLNLAQNYYNLASVYLELGQFSKAELFFLKAKNIQENTNGKEHEGYAHALGGLARLYIYQKKYVEAEPICVEIRRIQDEYLNENHPDFCHGFLNLAKVKSHTGKFEEAESLLNRAKNIAVNTGWKNSSVLKDILSDMTALYIASNHVSQALPQHREYVSLTQSFLLQSATFLSEKELDNYRKVFSDDLDLERSWLFSAPDSTKDFVPIAYSNTLFHKGFLLNAAATLRALASQDSASAKIYNQLASKRFLIDREHSKPADRLPYLEQWEQEANDLEKELARTVPGYAEAIRPVTWEEVKAKLNPGEAAVEFVSFRLRFPQETDSVLYTALVLLPDAPQPVFVPLCEQRQLDPILSAKRPSDYLGLPDFFQNQYASPRADGLPSLYELLWKPLEAHLKDIKTIYFSPDGELHRVNLAAIAPNKSGKVLADRYRLVPLASTRQLVVKNPGAETIRDAAVFGGALYDMDSAAVRAANLQANATARDTTGGWRKWLNGDQEEAPAGNRGENWEYLPGTLSEAIALDSMLRRRGIRSTLRTGYAATEESVKSIASTGQTSPGLLHIGTHGFFYADPKLDTSGREPAFKISEYPMIRAGLLLSGSKYAWEKGRPMGGMEDQILTAQDVSQLNLRQTYLTVFSACETGLGEIRGHEGVFGLQRATRLAGARNLIMSLWRVRDDAAEAFLGHFYANWLDRKMPLRQAFEETQKWMLGQEKYENPYFWAGFVLIGEP